MSNRITSLLLLTAMVLFGMAAFAIHPVAANRMVAHLAAPPVPPAGCELLPYCGYLQAHSNPGAVVSSSIAASQLPACGDLSICGYLQAHSLGSMEMAASVIPIPITGASEPLIACQSLAYCGYLQTHAAKGDFAAETQELAVPLLLPDCQTQPICDYLRAHSSQ